MFLAHMPVQYCRAQHGAFRFRVIKDYYISSRDPLLDYQRICPAELRLLSQLLLGSNTCTVLAAYSTSGRHRSFLGGLVSECGDGSLHGRIRPRLSLIDTDGIASLEFLKSLT